MKKIILSFTMVALGFLAAKAQSLMLHDSGGNNIGGTTVNVNTADVNSQVAYHAEVHNMAGVAKNVKVKRYRVSVQPLAFGDFCWTACYDPSVDLSPLGISLAAGTTNDTSFIAHYTPNGEVGTSTYKFTFFDAANPNDSVSFTLNFNIAVGINEAQANATVSNMYPNPASTFVSMKYDVNEYAKTAKIVVFDMLGKMVKELVLDEKQGVAKLNVSDLNSGVYFYSFLVDEKAIITKKLVVSTK